MGEGQLQENIKKPKERVLEQLSGFLDSAYLAIVPMAVIGVMATSFVSSTGNVLWGDGFIRIENGAVILAGPWKESLSGFTIFAGALWYILDDWYHSRLELACCWRVIEDSDHLLPMFSLDLCIAMLNFLVIGFALSGSRALGLVIALHLFLGGIWASGIKQHLYHELGENRRTSFRVLKSTHLTAAGVIIAMYFWRWSFDISEWFGAEIADDLTPGILLLGIMVAYRAWLRPVFVAARRHKISGELEC